MNDEPTPAAALALPVELPVRPGQERCADCRTPNACGDGLCLEAYIRRRIVQERDCRTCAHYTPHHYGEMLHCSSPIRCVGASSYKLSGGAQLWEAPPIEPAPF